MQPQITRSSTIAYKLPFGEMEICGILQAMQDALGISMRPLEFALVDDQEIAELNLNYLEAASPTNVLSFPHDSHISAPETISTKTIIPLGWMALSADTLCREAMLYGRTIEEYAISLMAHGIVHLIGHDHGPEMDKLAEIALKAGLEHLQKL